MLDLESLDTHLAARLCSADLRLVCCAKLTGSGPHINAGRGGGGPRRRVSLCRCQHCRHDAAAVAAAAVPPSRGRVPTLRRPSHELCAALSGSRSLAARCSQGPDCPAGCQQSSSRLYILRTSYQDIFFQPPDPLEWFTAAHPLPHCLALVSGLLHAV